MEPFRIKLEQVTFSQSDPSDEKVPQDVLDSFSNVVAYDQELLEESQQSFASLVSPQSSFQDIPNEYLNQSPFYVSNASSKSNQSAHTDSLHNKSRDQSYQSDSTRNRCVNSDEGEDGIINIGYQVNFQSPLVQLAHAQATPVSIVCTTNQQRHLHLPSADTEILIAREVIPDRNFIENETEAPEPEPEVGHAGVHGSVTSSRLDLAAVSAILERMRTANGQTTQTGSRPLSPSSTDDSSFTAFTSTTQALALQRSVIGSGTGIQPASPEEVARVLALTQQKLSAGPQTIVEQTTAIDQTGDQAKSGTENAALPALGPLSTPPTDAQTNHKPSNGDISTNKMQPARQSNDTRSPPPSAQNILQSASPNAFLESGTTGVLVSPQLTSPLLTIPQNAGQVPSSNLPASTQNSLSSFGLNQTQNASSGRTEPVSPNNPTVNPALIAIPHSDLTIVKESSARKVYATPSEDMKNKLKAKAKSHGNKLKTPKSARKQSASEHGSDTGRSTPSEIGDHSELKSGFSLDSLELSVKHNHRNDSGNGSATKPFHDTSSNYLLTQPHPVSTSTPAQTPSKITPQTQPFTYPNYQYQSALPTHQDILRLARTEQPTKLESPDIDRLLREKAHLEGQVEMLKLEAQTAVRERSDLQAQLGAFKSEFKSSSGSASAFRDRENLITDMQTIKTERDRLYLQVQKLQRSLDERSQEVRLAKDDLEASKRTNAKLQEKMGSHRKDVTGKESELEELKSRFAVVTHELQTLRQERRTMENQVRSVQNEIQAMSKTKDWYQQQLKAAQETRSTLQKEVSKMQLTTMEQSSSIEKLKSENAHVRQQLTESQQRALQEKENLVNHLERIERDMLEREAAVQQYQSDHALSEGSLYERIRRAEDEKHQLTTKLMITADLENELAKVKNELAQKDGEIELWERDHAQMMKTLTLAQESASQRQKEYEILQAKFMEDESKIKELIAHSEDKDSDILTLKDQKSALEVALSSANEEKRVIDTALEKLRNDMEKVESSFRMMKIDMDKKSQNLTQALNLNQSLEEELKKTRENLEKKRKSFEENNETMTGKLSVVNDLTEAKTKLTTEADALQQQVLSLQESLNRANQDKISIHEHLQNSENRILELTEKLSTALTEKSKLESSLNQAPKSDDLLSLHAENEKFKLQISDLQNQTSVALETKQNEIDRLEKELWSVRENLDDVKARHHEEMRLVGGRLREAGEAQHKAEWQVGELSRQVADGARVGNEQQLLQERIESLTEQLESVESDRDRLQTDLATLSQIAQADADKYKQTVSALQEELQEASKTLDQYKQTKDESLKLALDLEREKGRLAGVLQSHGALKQHTNDLEEALAEKESSLVDISLRTQQKLNEMSCHSSSTQQRISDMEQRSQIDQNTISELKEEIGNEKLNCGKLRNENEALKADLQILQTEFNDLNDEFRAYKETRLSTEAADEKLQTELETVRADYKMLQNEFESLQRQLSDTREKDPVVNESIKTLQWELDQKSVEMAGWREQVNLAEQRQQVEMDSVRKALQTTKEEVDKLRSELSHTRKEKFNYQAKLSELRGTVKACLRGRIDEDGVSQEDPQQTESGNLVNGDDHVVDSSTSDQHQSALLIINRMLDDTNTPEYDSKPLAALHQCMTSLRSQMSGLQEEIDHHSMAVFSSSQSWKQVENQVKELRDLCSSDERSDAESVTSSQTAEDLVQKLLSSASTESSVKPTTNIPIEGAMIESADVMTS